jgi:hypothetical protein
MPSISPSLARLCRWIRYGAVFFVTAVIAIYLVAWISPDITHHRHPVLQLAGLPGNLIASFPLEERALLAAVSVPYLAVLVWAFHRLVRMLRAFERGAFFDRQTVSDLRAFSGLLLVSKLLSLAAMHIRVAMAIHLMPHKARVGVINLSSDDLAIVLLCALFFAIAAMMEEGRKLAEENREFV